MSTGLTQRSARREFTVFRAPTPVVFIVDGDVAVREPLVSLIRDAGWQPEIFGSASGFLARPPVLAPSCLVLDIALPDLNGLDLQTRVAVERSSMPVIFLTGCRDVSVIVQAMKAGAIEFLTKPFRAEVLLAAIRDAIDHSRTALEREAQIRELRDSFASLSRREREVMARVVAGRLNKQSAAELGISEITVKVHRGRVMRKMHAGSIADLVNMDARLRLSSVPADSGVDAAALAAPRGPCARAREPRARASNRQEFALYG